MSVKVGRDGEDQATLYLKTAGYRVLERNYYTRYGEVDIIAKDPDGVLVFCEVKTYKKDSWVHPLEMIGSKKLERIRRCAQVYIKTKGALELPCRLDVVLVLAEGGVEHLENVG